MLFNSIPFAVFLPVVFLVYWLLRSKSLLYQNLFLLLSSYFFYGYWDFRLLILILISSLTDYIAGNKIQNAKDEVYRKRWLYFSLFINLGILGVFKYFNFFVNSLVDLTSTLGFTFNTYTLQFILPVGISFYTFQTLSYTIDIYRRKLEPTKDPVAFFTYVAFFPQLVAGPIERAKHLLPQFLQKRKFDTSQATAGLRLMLWGFFKKIVIADNLAIIVDTVYNDPSEHSGLAVVIATIAFAFQIYADFSGYSDIAIGTAKLFGFEIMQNFRTPYFATSLKEFWSRWHISLSSWFRDYVYIPLGGNKAETPRWLFNLFLTFLISGLWHGAALTFIIWGAIHGIFFNIEALIRKNIPTAFQLPPYINWIITFIIVNIAWIFFRAPDITSAFVLISALTERMFYIDHQLLVSLFGNFNNLLFIPLSFLVFMVFEILIKERDFNVLMVSFSRTFRWGIYYLLVLWIMIFGAFEITQRFIYFQF